MDTVSVLVGFLIGIVAMTIAVEFGLKKIFRPPAVNKVTGSWRLSDHQAPLVVAQDAGSVALPTGSRVVTAGDVASQGFKHRDHRRNPNARSNFLVDPELDRALLFMGPIREGTLALATLDPAIAQRLRAEHRRLWETGEAYVDDLPLAQVAKNTGVLVRVQARVQECVPYRERHLLRLTDGTHAVGALVDEALDLQGKQIIVTGRVVRGTSGYPLLDAEEVRLAGTGERAVARAPVPAQTGNDPATAEPPPQEQPPKRVLRVPQPPGGQRQSEPVPVEQPQEPPVPENEPEAPEEGMTEADKRRARARVTLHR